MTLTNLLIVTVIVVVLIDIRYTRKWLRTSETYLRELREHVAKFVPEKKPE